MNTHSLTPKQRSLMKIIIAGDGRDEHGQLIPADMDQILERLDYKTTKSSIHFSYRALIKRGFIEKLATRVRRRDRLRVVFAPTALGISISQSSPTISFLENELVGSTEDIFQNLEF